MLNSNLSTWSAIVVAARRAITELEIVERELGQAMRQIENAAAERDSVMTPAEKAKWKNHSDLQKVVVRKKLQIVDASAIALDAHPAVQRMRARFQHVNRDLEKAKENLEQIAVALKSINKALEAIVKILEIIPT